MLVLHIGIQKTGTTFLQKAVFPHWRGIRYLRTDNLEKLLRIDDRQVNLLSREGLSGRNWDGQAARIRCIVRLAELFPEARIILSFRRHAGYILSSYNHYIQRGGTLSFDEYFDPVNNQGLMKTEDFLFFDKVKAVESAFGRRPFIYTLEEFRDGMDAMLGDLAVHIGGQPPKASELRAGKENPSLGRLPLKMLRRINRHTRSELNKDGRWPLKHWRLQRLGLDPRTICQSWLRFLPRHGVVPDQLIAWINDHYAQDWQQVLDYQAARKTMAFTAVDADT